jgi:hypothetical protein
MSCRRACVLVVMFSMGSGAWISEAHAQPAWVHEVRQELATRDNGWTLGLSTGGVWGPNDMADDARTRHGAFDISVQRQIDGMWSDGGDAVIRVQIGRGGGYDSGLNKFDYRRVMVGVFREFAIIPSPRPWAYIHVGAGAGAYRINSAVEHGRSASLFAEGGFEVRLGPSPVTLGPDLQIHTIGDGGLYSTTSIVARIRLR